MSINAQIESSILEALKADFPTFDVVSFPVDFENYSFTSPTGCMLVKFSQTNFNEQYTLWEVNQEGDTLFEIISGYRGLNNYGELHAPLQNLKNSLQGLEVLGRKIILIKEEFLKEINTDLFCKITCKIKTYQDEAL